MATIAITFVDAPDGKVDITMFVEGVEEGAPMSPAMKLAQAMLQAAKEEVTGVTDIEPKTH